VGGRGGGERQQVTGEEANDMILSFCTRLLQGVLALGPRRRTRRGQCQQGEQGLAPCGLRTAACPASTLCQVPQSNPPGQAPGKDKAVKESKRLTFKTESRLVDMGESCRMLPPAGQYDKLSDV